jgi:hypothetical protein
MFSITSKLNTIYPNIEKRVKFVFLKGGKTKQWPLAGEFVEFEYWPKIRQIFVTRSGEFGEY